RDVWGVDQRLDSLRVGSSRIGRGDPRHGEIAPDHHHLCPERGRHGEALNSDAGEQGGDQESPPPPALTEQGQEHEPEQRYCGNEKARPPSTTPIRVELRRDDEMGEEYRGDEGRLRRKPPDEARRGDRQQRSRRKEDQQPEAQREEQNEGSVDERVPQERRRQMVSG